MAYTRLDMPAALSRLFADDAFEEVMRLKGKVFRDVPGRKTIQVELSGQSLFVKQHYGVGWSEVLKNLSSLRLPVFSAATEWRAIRRFGEIGIPTTPAIAYGERGLNLVTRRSFLMTQDLGDIVSLEDFCRDWGSQPPPLQLKRQVLAEVARITRLLHEHGMNHRDLYLCHYCLDRHLLEQGKIRIYLIDLHRVGIRPSITQTARLKDLAALYFSVLDIGLSNRDYLRFLRLYRGQRLSRILRNEQGFWRRVSDRADMLYTKFHKRRPEMPSLPGGPAN
jgi:heptose I phosphotransferase